MSQSNRTIVSLMPEELDALDQAAESRFGESNRISRGAMVRLMAEEYGDE